MSIANTGGSTATNVADNVSVVLSPGFTYVSTTSGPPTERSPAARP